MEKKEKLYFTQSFNILYDNFVLFDMAPASIELEAASGLKKLSRI